MPRVSRLRYDFAFLSPKRLILCHDSPRSFTLCHPPPLCTYTLFAAYHFATFSQYIFVAEDASSHKSHCKLCFCYVCDRCVLPVHVF